MKKKQLGLALGASVAASASLLAATSSERYVYDASGNIVEKQIGAEVTRFEFEGNLLQNSLKADNRKEFSYDSAGRLNGEMEGGKLVRQLDYQFDDKVTQVTRGDETTELFYNAEGQLVGTSGPTGELETLVWDGLAMVARGDKANVVEEHLTGGIPALVGDEVSVSDMLGNTLSVGEEKFEFTAYGEGLENGLFTGKPYVKELEGFIFHRRGYSPSLSRWLTSDPSGYPDGKNNFLYVKGQPLELVDPDGLTAKDTEKDAVSQRLDPATYVKFDAEYTYTQEPTPKAGSIKIDPLSSTTWSNPTATVSSAFTGTPSTQCGGTDVKKWDQGTFEVTADDSSTRTFYKNWNAIKLVEK